MKNRKNHFAALFLSTFLFICPTLQANHIRGPEDEDLAPVAGNYLHFSVDQLAAQVAKTLHGARLPQVANGRDPDFIYHKTRRFRLTLEAIRVDRVPRKATPQVVSNTGQKPQKIKSGIEGDDLEILGLIAIEPLHNGQVYRMNVGANDLLFSRDLHTGPLQIGLNQKKYLGQTRDFYIREAQGHQTGFRFKFALLEYDKEKSSGEAFESRTFEVRTNQWSHEKGEIQRFERQLATPTNDQVVTVFFEVELIPQISGETLRHAICDRDLAETERLFRQGANPATPGLFVCPAQTGYLAMLNLLTEFGASPQTADLNELLNDRHFRLETVQWLVRHGAQPDAASLHKAIEIADRDLLRYFLREGARPTTQNILRALDCDQREMAVLLIEYGAPVDAEVLKRATQNRDHRLVRLILEKGIKPAPELLVYSVRERDFELTRLLSEKVKPDHRAMLEAVRQNDAALLDLLARAGGRIRGDEPARLAIDFNNLPLLDLVLRNGGNPDRALEYALNRHHPTLVRFLLDGGANPDVALPFAVRDSDLAFFEMLLTRYRANADRAFELALNARNDLLAEKALGLGYVHPARHLKTVAAAGDLKWVEILIEKGADPDTGMKPAVDQNRLKTVEYLLWQGANPNGHIDRAARKGHQDMVFLLLEYGADPDAAMKSAVEAGQNDIVEMLLKYGARTEGQLSAPAARGEAGLVKTLLDGGANPNEGMRAALQHQQTGIVEMLLNHGARPGGYLDIPIEKNNRELVRLLLEYGANPNEGMALAVKKNDHAIVRLLLDYGADGTDPAFL
ncbi:MAG: hypothetical protein D6714_06450, partial [Bacteroidetes bacterium]